LEEKLKAIDEEQEMDDIVVSKPSVNGATAAKSETGQETGPKTHLLAANVAYERFAPDSTQERQPIIQQVDPIDRTGLRKRTTSDRSFRSLFEVNAGAASPSTRRVRGTSLSIRVDGVEANRKLIAK